MKIKHLFLFAALIGAVILCMPERKKSNQAKVNDTVFSTAIETAQKSIDFAKNNQARAFAEQTFEFNKNRNGYYECYQLLQNIQPPADAKWNVSKDLNNSNINVSCALNKKLKLLIVLKKLPDNSMKFAYACTLNT